MCLKYSWDATNIIHIQPIHEYSPTLWIVTDTLKVQMPSICWSNEYSTCPRYPDVINAHNIPWIDMFQEYTYSMFITANTPITNNTIGFQYSSIHCICLFITLPCRLCSLDLKRKYLNLKRNFQIYTQTKSYFRCTLTSLNED